MQRVLEIFEEILSIPRSSGKEEKIAKYILEFAKTHNLEYNIDRYNNVFIKKNNNSDKTIILQAHSDMVCVAREDYDFDNKGIEFYVDGDYYKAKKTSLGADDGIGLAIILAMLEEENMPNIEVMITTQEETTMLGAVKFDYNLLTGKTLISLDGTNEAYIESSSAGMRSITLNKRVTNNQKNLNCYKLTISNLRGGHSGDDIDKNRTNAIKLAFDILKKININEICNFKFGEKDNVISNEGVVVFSSEKEIDEIRNLINSVEISLSYDDKDLNLELEINNNLDIINESEDIIRFINDLDDGLLATFEDEFPLLSSNIGALNLVNGELIIKLSIRSSDVELENKQLEKLENLCKKYNFNFKIEAKKPFFAYSPNSNIRELLSYTYKKLYSKDTITRKVHACMEGGIISNNIEGLDIVAIAPTIDDCHTVNEKVSISSIKRVYKWLKETLIEFNKKE